ncbi:MAG: hypothetical protein ACFFCS_15100 [Candidatus Hodarchaeota archaeon]
MEDFNNPNNDLNKEFVHNLEERLQKGESDFIEVIFDYLITIVNDNNESIGTLNERINEMNKYLHEAMTQVSDNNKEYIQFAINAMQFKMDERLNRLEEMIMAVAKGEVPERKPLSTAVPIFEEVKKIVLPEKPSLPPPPPPPAVKPKPVQRRTTTLLEELKEAIKHRKIE